MLLRLLLFFFFALSLLHPLNVFDKSLNAGCYFTLPLILMLFSFSYWFIIIFFIKQGIYENQDDKQIIPEIILCSLYIHTFVKNKVDVYIKI